MGFAHPGKQGAGPLRGAIARRISHQREPLRQGCEQGTASPTLAMLGPPPQGIGGTDRSDQVEQWDAPLRKTRSQLDRAQPLVQFPG